MANAVSNVSFQSPSYDYSADVSAIERRKALAAELQKQSLQQDGGTQVINGWAVPQGKSAGFAKLAQAVAGIQGQQSAEDEQRSLSKKVRGSTNRREARCVLSRQWERVANQRRDFQFKEARKLVQRFGRIAVEKLDITDMVQQNGSRGLHRGILDAAWRGFVSALSSKAEEAGSVVVLVEARGTTRRCSACGVDVPKSLSERTHRCACGLEMDRDANAALNILERARTEPPWRCWSAGTGEAGSPAL